MINKKNIANYKTISEIFESANNITDYTVFRMQKKNLRYTKIILLFSNFRVFLLNCTKRPNVYKDTQIITVAIKCTVSRKFKNIDKIFFQRQF
jgi:hypothetical protein